jgi:phosphodiesterase/alkaline phosphatase D-like protein
MSDLLRLSRRISIAILVLVTGLTTAPAHAQDFAILTSMPASSITSSGATLNGSVNPQSSSGEVFFQWATDPTFKSPVNTSKVPVGAGIGIQSFSALTDDMPSATNVFFRVAYYNSGNNSYQFGRALTFVVGTATLLTEPATSIGSSSAVLNANVNTNGSNGEVFFQWATDPSFKTPHATMPQPASSFSSTENFAVTIDGLPSANLIFYRVVFHNGDNYSYEFGGNMSFMVGTATLLTQPATNIGSSNAVLNANVNPQGSNGHVFFQWATDPSFKIPRVTMPQPVSSFGGAESFTVEINALPSATLIFYRVGFFDSNNNSYEFGATFSFMVGTATLMTQPATGIGSSSATLNGSVNPQGSSGGVFFQWDTDPSFKTPHNTATQPVSPFGIGGTEGFAVQIDKLPSATMIFFRIGFYDSNNHSYEFGSNFSFMVGTATLFTQPATNIGSSTAVLNGSVNPQGSDGKVFFQWGTDPSFKTPVNTPVQPVSGYEGMENFAIQVSHLPSATMIFYRIAFFDNNNGSYEYGTTFSFMVGTATLVTEPVTSLGSKTATLNGTVNPQGSSGNVYFQFGADPSFKVSMVTPRVPISAFTGMENFSVPVTNLPSATMMFYRIAFYDGDNHTYEYGPTVSFESQ